MKLLFICFFAGWCCCSIAAWGRGDLEKYGPFQLALHSSLIKCDHDKNHNLGINYIRVHFYDFTKSQQEISASYIDDAAKTILIYKDLDRKKKFIIFVPGYKSAINKTTEDTVRNAFRNVPNTYLIILDHSTYTNDKDGHIKSYERSVKYVYYIGKALANMLIKLQKGGILPKQIHCIGHSLGGQLLGHTGEIFLNNTGQKLARISALDPAGPCFSNSLIEEQIRSGVADYVDVYHCNAGGLGTTSVLGDVDFFLNRKGESQPKCGTPLIPGIFDSSKAAKCSHKACVQLYMATVANPSLFPAWQCESYREFKIGMCISHEVTTAGFWAPGNATGVYYFATDGFDVINDDDSDDGESSNDGH